MKKALIVSNTAGLVTDFLENDFEILKYKGFEIVCACNTNFIGKKTPEFFEKYNVKVEHVDFPIRDLNLRLIFRSMKQLKKIISENTFDIIHCHSTIAASLCRQCAKAVREKNRTKIIYTSHGFPFFEGNNGIKAKVFKLIEKYYSKFTDAIITICEEDYNNALKMNFKNVYYMHGVGVSIDKFLNCNINREHYRDFLGFSKDDIVVLSIGEINTNKNHQIIIKALAKISNKKIVYAICGREVTEIGKKDELLSLANKLDVDVRFLGYRTDIPEICCSCDIGAFPSYKEGLGLSGIEMLAAGLPIAGSNRQGIKDYIVNGKTGYLADPNDVDEFSKAILNTIDLSLLPYTKNTCQEMTKKFDKKQAFDLILFVYDSLFMEEYNEGDS